MIKNNSDSFRFQTHIKYYGSLYDDCYGSHELLGYSDDLMRLLFSCGGESQMYVVERYKLDKNTDERGE